MKVRVSYEVPFVKTNYGAQPRFELNLSGDRHYKISSGDSLVVECEKKDIEWLNNLSNAGIRGLKFEIVKEGEK